MSHYKIAFICLMDGDLVLNPEHVGVGLLMQVLREEGYSCEVFELNRNNHEDVLRAIELFSADMIGLSLMSINKVHAAEFGRKVKDRFPSIHICCGGPAATYGGTRLMESRDGDYMDSIVIGEGEETIVEMVKRLKQGQDLEGVSGVCYRRNGEIYANPRRPPVHELDYLPFPARDQFEQHDCKLEYIRISTSRGCTSKCTFCSAPNVTNRYISNMKVWRGRSAEHVVAEIKHLYHKYNFNTFDFVDSTFEDPGKIGKKRIQDIAEGILDNDLEIFYNCCMQAMNWSDDDRDLLQLLARSGLEKVLVGIESGSDIGLSHWQKRSNTEDNKRVIRLLREQGIYVAFGFIAFHPHSTIEEIRDNTEFLKEYMGYNLRRFGTRLEVYPGTTIEDILREQNLLLPEYDHSLDCLAYEYIDPNVKEFANAFASMFGIDYEKNLVINEEPSVFKFETFDIVLHTYTSRIMRLFGDRAPVVELMNDFKEVIKSVYNELTEFNYNLFDYALTQLEEGKFMREHFSDRAAEVERFYASKMNELKRYQLQTSRKLMNAGVDISLINSRKASDFKEKGRKKHVL